MRLGTGCERTEAISFNSVRNTGVPLYGRMRTQVFEPPVESVRGIGDPGGRRQDLSPRAYGYGHGVWCGDGNGDGTGSSADLSFDVNYVIGLLVGVWEAKS